MRTRVRGRVGRYDRIAGEYDARFGAECALMHRLVLAEIDRRELEPSAVLDVGCGTGALLALLADRLPATRLIGADPSAGMIAIARARVPAASFVVAMAEALDLPDGAVDLVVSTTSFGQWADHAAGMREIARVLAPGGLAVVIEHERPGLWQRMVYRLPDLVTPAEMAGIVRGAGLSMRDQRVVGKDYLVTVCARG